MNREESVKYAHSKIVETIWKEAKLEGIGITFPQTWEIFEGRETKGLKLEDVKIVNNLKHAWQFLFDTLDYPVNMQWLSQTHIEIGKDIIIAPGDIRTGVVEVTTGDGVIYPEIPDMPSIIDKLHDLEKIEDPQDRAINTFGYIAKTQMFQDGNKRVAQLATNKILIENGEGIFAIKPEDDFRFRTLLVNYYIDNNIEPLAKFMKANCILKPELDKIVQVDKVGKEQIIQEASNIQTNKNKNKHTIEATCANARKRAAEQTTNNNGVQTKHKNPKR